MKNASSDKQNLLETAVALLIGNTVIPAVLHDCRASRDLFGRLPYSVRLQKYDHDYCGIMAQPLVFDEGDLRSGWINGDIAFAADGNYFAILYKDEEISGQYGNLVTLGRITVDPAIMDTLPGEIRVTIALKQA
nr:cyclophilin-like fold protein [uncultured Desulfobulbus sp.]